MIYATPLSSPRGKYNSAVRTPWFTAALVVLTVAGEAGQRPPQPLQPHLRQWREAPEFVRQFAPAGRRAGAFRTFVSADDLETALAALNIEPAPRPDAMWAPRPVAPLDAFGRAGAYDRSKVARLYGAMRPRVARGTIDVDGNREYWTLISPHPDAALQRLEDGTLLLVLRYDGGNPGP